ncbi:MAG: ECF transporter S component, partial [Erysipelotrichia bacterium]|nr:ECF transporter S component [Erysipelotrichia bacterium]
MFQKFTPQKIVLTGLLLALEILFQILSNYIQIGPVNLNLSLLAVTFAAILAGPLSGGILGFFNGILTLLSPSTIAIFMPISLFGTVVTVLLKCTLGG